MKVLKLASMRLGMNTSQMVMESDVKYNFINVDFDKCETRIAFFSKGNIFLECGQAIFEIKNSQGLSLSETDCFGQLISNDFNRLYKTCHFFRYNGSPVKFTVSFYDKNDQLLAQLISDSIFKNIGFGKGEGRWKIN